MAYKREIQIGGKPLSLETAALGKQAHGAVVVRYGATVVLATACYKEGAVIGGFMPLTVDYKEYTYAGGRIPGGFFKREGRPTEKEILTSRLIDRPLRPSFPDGYRQETQIIALVLSADGENDPDILAINAASAALMVSPIPFPNAIGAVRIGSVEGKLVVNPTNSQRDLSDLDLVVAGTEDAIVMVEAGAREVSEEHMLDALDLAQSEIRKIVAMQKEMQREGGKPKIEVSKTSKYDQAIYDEMFRAHGDKLRTALLTPGKHNRKDAVSVLAQDLFDGMSDEEVSMLEAKKHAFADIQTRITRELIARDGKRLDGRAPNEIRPI